MFKLAASKHGLNGLLHLATKISKLSFDRHCSILIFIGDNYPDGVIGMLFRSVHCDSRGDKPVDDGINNKVMRIPQLRYPNRNPAMRCLFKCDLCDAGYVGYTKGHLHTRVEGHRQKASSIYRHYCKEHNTAVPNNFLARFNVITKCTNKFDCLVNEMLCIQYLKPALNVQSDSLRAKVFM